VREQITITGSCAHPMADFEQTLSRLTAGLASLGEVPPVLPLEDGPEMFTGLVEGPPDQLKMFLADAGREA
jgi:hypothetical protein